MFSKLREDYRRYDLKGASRLYIAFEQGFWAMCIYRFGQWAHSVRVPLLGFLLRFIAFTNFKVIEILTGISLPPSAKIGTGFFVGHFGGIIVHSEAVIGDYCSIGPGVVIGTRGVGNAGVPRLGNNVYVGVGAKVLGGVRIGNNVRIGANAVVLSDVPDGSTVVGIPGRIVEKA